MYVQALILQLFMVPLLAAAESDCFEVTDEALKLARKLLVVKDDLAYSSGVVVDSSRPYGGESVQVDVRRLLKNPKLTEKESERLHRDSLRAFQIMLRFGALAPGSYSLEDGSTERVTLDQIKLQPHFNFVDEIESGATGIDPKRPYGDSECWELDMADALDVKPLGDEDTACEDSFTPAQQQRFQTLHKSMVGFIRALLAHGKLIGRRYKADALMIGVWERCE